jgi:hypothetical protein
MNTRRLFWGSLVILVGVALLINQIIPDLDIGIYIWPGILIFAGLWLLLRPGRASRQRSEEPRIEYESYSLSLDGAAEAAIELNHGAGRLKVSSMEDPILLLDGKFKGGVEESVDRSGSMLKVKLKPPSFDFWDTFDMQGLNWNLSLNNQIPLSLVVNSGANESFLDLSNLKVKEMSLGSGASSTEIKLPQAAGYTRVKVGIVAASEGVAARISKEGGLSAINIDEARFPRSGDVYESPDYADAENKAEISVEAGVGAVDIR